MGVMDLEVFQYGGTPAVNSFTVFPTQLTDPFQEMYKSHIALEPLFDPEVWATAMTISARYSQLVRVYARNVAGLGFKIVPTTEIQDGMDPKLRTKIETDVAKLTKLYSKPHTACEQTRFQVESFPELFTKMVMDREATGNGYLEVARGALTKEPEAIWHIPATTMRIRNDLDGYIQYSQRFMNQYVYFKNFGDPRIMSRITGRFQEEEKKEIPLSERANEILHFPLYTPMSTHYGIPRVAAAQLALVGNDAAARRNLAFFRNDGVPRAIVTIKSGNVSNETATQIREFFSAIHRSPEQAHRVLFLCPKVGQAGDPVELQVDKLTVGQEEDATFTTYRKNNSEEMRECFGLSELHLGSEGSANRSVAQVILRLVNQQELIPAILDLEYRLNATLGAACHAEHAVIELRRPKGNDVVDEAKILQRAIPGGALTPSDIRNWTERALGIDLEPFTAAWARVPLTLLLTLLREPGVISLDSREEISSSIKTMINEINNTANSTATTESSNIDTEVGYDKEEEN